MRDAAGGGIPVVADERGHIHAVAAVIDKDFASSLLASVIEADVFIISAAVERVALNWGRPEQQRIDRMTLSEAKRHLAEGSTSHRAAWPPRSRPASSSSSGVGERRSSSAWRTSSRPSTAGPGRTSSRTERERPSPLRADGLRRHGHRAQSRTRRPSSGWRTASSAISSERGRRRRRRRRGPRRTRRRPARTHRASASRRRGRRRPSRWSCAVGTVEAECHPGNLKLQHSPWSQPVLRSERDRRADGSR